MLSTCRCTCARISHDRSTTPIDPTSHRCPSNCQHPCSYGAGRQPHETASTETDGLSFLVSLNLTQSRPSPSCKYTIDPLSFVRAGHRRHTTGRGKRLPVGLPLSAARAMKSRSASPGSPQVVRRYRVDSKEGATGTFVNGRPDVASLFPSLMGKYTCTPALYGTRGLLTHLSQLLIPSEIQISGSRNYRHSI